MIVQIKKQYLSLKKVQNFCNKSQIDIFIDVIINLNTQKQKFEMEQKIAIYNGF